MRKIALGVLLIACVVCLGSCIIVVAPRSDTWSGGSSPSRTLTTSTSDGASSATATLTISGLLSPLTYNGTVSLQYDDTVYAAKFVSNDGSYSEYFYKSSSGTSGTSFSNFTDFLDSSTIYRVVPGYSVSYLNKQ